MRTSILAAVGDNQWGHVRAEATMAVTEHTLFLLAALRATIALILSSIFLHHFWVK